jgi:beta-glucosidase
MDAIMNRAFPDPQWLGKYPEPIADDIKPYVQDGDLDIVKQKLDFFAFNHYSRARIRWDKDDLFHIGYARIDAPVTAMGWPITPDGLRMSLVEAKERWSGDTPVYILENGAAFDDAVDSNGRVHDPQRVAFLRDYLGALLDAASAGVPVKGYFVWSLLDNFEWALGYDRRFGIVYVDYATQKRIPKDSFYFYRELANGGPLDR